MSGDTAIDETAIRFSPVADYVGLAQAALNVTSYFIYKRSGMILGKLIKASLVLAGLSFASQAEDKPNILFITIDDLNNDLGAYGHNLVKSPNIDKLAAKGVRFDKAYSQAPLCTPSRSSFMTGLYPDQTGIIAHGSHTQTNPHFRTHIPGVTTLPQFFRKNGYFSGRIGKIYHQGVPNQIGTSGPDDPASWDEVVNPIGVDRLDESGIQSYNKGALERRSFGGTLSWRSVKGPDSDHTDSKIASEAIAMLKRHHPAKTGKPFFLGVGFYRPHTPYVAPEKYFDMYPLDRIKPYKMPANDRNDIPEVALHNLDGKLSLTTEQRKVIIQAYYASISFMDAQVGRVLNSLEELGLADNTIIVFVSDHGYELGQHGLWQKGSLFEGSTRIPMIIYAPNKMGNGKAASAPVEMVDIYPTLTSLTGLNGPDYLAGEDLTPMLDDTSVAVREGAYSAILNRYRGVDGRYSFTKIRGHSIRTNRYRYTEWGDGIVGVELYDHANDPEELTNLADKVPLESVRIKLKWLLVDRVKAASKRVREIE